MKKDQWVFLVMFILYMGVIGWAWRVGHDKDKQCVLKCPELHLLNDNFECWCISANGHTIESKGKIK